MLAMKGKGILTLAILMGGLAVLGGWAFAAQDKYSVKVPNGLAFCLRYVHPRHLGWQAAAGERRQVRIRVPHDGEDKRLRFHGLRAQVKRDEQCTDEQWTPNSNPGR